LLVLANGVFAAAEIALVSARRSRLERQAEAGHHRARLALDLAANPDRFLATVQIGITLISTLAAAFGGASLATGIADVLATVPALHSSAESIALVIVVLLISYLSLVLGELVPKRLALAHAEAIATGIAPVMTALARIARPVIALLSASVTLVLRLVGQRQASEAAVTEEDITYLVRQGTASGTVEPAEAEFIQRAFQFTDRVVRSIMTPRPALVAVAVETPLDAIVTTIVRSGHSRLPVYHDSLDHVLGILHARDLLPLLTGEQAPDLRLLLRPAIFLVPHQHIDDVLATFRQQEAQVALVVDEYGQIEGLVTVEDVLEELVGELPNEHGQPQAPSMVQLEDGTWLVDGTQTYETARVRVGLPAIAAADRHEYATLAGFVLARLGRIPTVGDTVTAGDFTIQVVDMDGRRVDKLAIRRTV
jgi:putative hemolysin